MLIAHFKRHKQRESKNMLALLYSTLSWLRIIIGCSRGNIRTKIHFQPLNGYHHPERE
jgi:hypothetical protein